MLTLKLSFWFFNTLILIVGVVMFTYPPKKPQVWYGYRTPQALSSQLKWDIAHELAPVLLIAISVLTSFYVFVSSSPDVYENAVKLATAGIFAMFGYVEGIMHYKGRGI